MGESTTAASSPDVTESNQQNPAILAIVVSIGGIIITASIIIIVVVAVFVRKSTRELKQQTRSNQNRPHGPRPAHATSVRMAQGQRVEVIRRQSEAQVDTGQDPQDTEKAQRVPDEIQGFYADIPRCEDLGSGTDGQADTGEKGGGILYAALEFDDVAEKPGKPLSSEEETGTRPLTGPSVVVPSSQPDTYVEMEPLVASFKNDSAPVECYPAGGIYDLARDPDAVVSTSGFPPEQTDPGLYQNLPAGDKGNETLLLTDM